MYTKTFHRDGTTFSFAEFTSPRHLRELAKARRMTGVESRRFAQDRWGLQTMVSEAMLDAIAHVQTRTEMQLMPLRLPEGSFGILACQAEHYQYRFVLPLYEPGSRELLGLLSRQGFTITWHADRGDRTERKTRHQLPAEHVSPVLDLCHDDLADDAGLTTKLLPTVLASLNSRDFVPSLIDGVEVKAVHVAIVYERAQHEAIADSLV